MEEGNSETGGSDMKISLLFGTTAVALLLALGAAPTTLALSNKPLSEKDTKKLLKASEKELKEARKASEQGKTEAAAHAARFTENLDRINNALASDEVRENDALDVAARVDEATLKHIPVLEGLLETVPEQARPAIERALEASRRGHDTATEAILNHGQVSLPGGLLTDRTARQAMDKNEALLKQAERGRQRGDEAAVGRSVEQFTRNIDAVGRAIETDAVDQREAISVLDRVDRNTRRHVSVLEGLLGQVPEQARPAIERAIQASQRGQQAATQALARTPAAGVQAGRPGAAGAPADIGGRPTGAGGGPPSGTPGPPSGRHGPPH